MSWMPIGADQWPRRSSSGVETPDVTKHHRLASIILRTIFIASILIVTVHVSMPQSETLWTVYDTPGDLIRVLLGLAVCVWLAIQLFIMPKDDHAHRMWLYLGLAAVPFALICIVGIW